MVMENKPCCWQHPGPITLDSDQSSPGQSCDPNWAWDRVKRVPESSCFTAGTGSALQPFQNLQK